MRLFWDVLMDLGSSDFAQIADVFVLYRSVWVSGADFIRHMDCLAEEGPTFDDF